MWFHIKKTKDQFQRLIYLVPLSLTSYLFLKQKYPWLPGYSCPIRHATGVPCPSCFLTRSICATLGGDFQYAFKLHIFGPPIAFLLILWSITSLREKRFLSIKPKRNIVYMSIFAFIAYWIYRIILHFQLGIETFPKF